MQNLYLSFILFGEGSLFGKIDVGGLGLGSVYSCVGCSALTSLGITVTSSLPHDEHSHKLPKSKKKSKNFKYFFQTSFEILLFIILLLIVQRMYNFTVYTS